MYGYESEGPGDHMIQVVDQAMEDLAVILTPGEYLADIIPIRALSCCQRTGVYGT